MHEVAPDAWKAMYALSGYLKNTKLTATHKNLISVRASQLNNCAFCLDMHTKEARTAGETEQRLFVVSAWRETSLFTPEEKAVLAVTEEVTLISQHGLTDASYSNARQYFDEKYIANLIMAIIIINGWNRIAVSTHLQIPA